MHPMALGVTRKALNDHSAVNELLGDTSNKLRSFSVWGNNFLIPFSIDE